MAKHGGHREGGGSHKTARGIAQILRENIQMAADVHFDLETTTGSKFPDTLPSGVELARRQIRIRGVVQGVGFRPFVHNLARRMGLAGYVLNSSAGVVAEVEGAPARWTVSPRALRSEAPPLARIEELLVAEIEPLGEPDFTIRESQAREGEFVLVSPDVATCPDCYRDFTDPAQPALSAMRSPTAPIAARAIPSSATFRTTGRNTTMAGFRMCAACQAEYDDPGNRRFHAQPNACAECGPQLSAPIAEAQRRLSQGEIVAIRGLGGFHLACDPRNDGAVRLLRERKRRSDKPFALMARDLDAAEAFCAVSDDDRRALSGPRRPIVVLPRRADSGISAAVAPGSLGLTWNDCCAFNCKAPATIMKRSIIFFIAGLFSTKIAND